MTLILSGTDGLSDVDGTAATPALRGTDANTGIFFPAADTIAFSEGGVEAMRIDSSGNVGIGTSPAYKLDVLVASNKNIVAFTPTSSSGISDFSAGGVGWGFSRPSSGLVNSVYSYDTAAAAKNNFVIQGRSDIVFTNGGDYTNASERARIDSSGRLLINGTQSTTNTFLQVNANGGNSAQAYMAVMANGSNVANQTVGIYLGRTNNSITTSVDGAANFRDNIVVQAGGSAGVLLASGATAWASNSDLRKKIIIEPISNALSGILSWRTIIGRYKTDDEQKRRLFLIAQDVQATNPEAVFVQDTGQESEELLLGYSDTIPVLVAAIKEQQALITALTTRITALEAA